MTESPPKKTPLRVDKRLLSHRTNAFATHQPVLCEALSRTDGPVLELGCGEGSTELLHELCAAEGRALVTADSSLEWLARYSERLADDRHQFVGVKDWGDFLAQDVFDDTFWAVVFIDCAPWESRVQALHRLKSKASFVIIHDCDYFPSNGVFGRVLEPIRGPARRGYRDYGDVFKSWREFFPLDPWPYELTGPPTLLGSDHLDCGFDIDYAEY